MSVFNAPPLQGSNSSYLILLFSESWLDYGLSIFSFSFLFLLCVEKSCSWAPARMLPLSWHNIPVTSEPVESSSNFHNFPSLLTQPSQTIWSVSVKLKYNISATPISCQVTMSGPIVFKAHFIMVFSCTCSKLVWPLGGAKYFYVPPQLKKKKKPSRNISYPPLWWNIDGTMSACCFPHLNAIFILEFSIYCVTVDPVCG